MTRRLPVAAAIVGVLLATHAGAQEQEFPSEAAHGGFPTAEDGYSVEDGAWVWGQTTYYPALKPAEPVANLVRAFPPRLLRHPLDLPESIRLALSERRMVDGPSVEEYTEQIIPHVTDIVRSYQLLLYVERRGTRQDLVGWLPVGDLPAGVHYLGGWWIWRRHREVQWAERYPESAERIRREMTIRGVSAWSERDVERHVEAGRELNLSVETYMLRYRLSLEEAILRVKRERIELERILIVGYFGAFASAAGLLAGGPAPEELAATMKPSTLAGRQRYAAPTVRSGQPAGAQDVAPTPTPAKVPAQQNRYQPPYDPHQVRQELEERHPGEVSSGTVPKPGSKNVPLAGKAHPKTKIVFDQRGFPIFDDVAAFDTRLPPSVSSVPNRATHFRAATAQLREAVERGQVPRDRFTPEQLQAIARGKEKIPGYTWHHHQDVGRMQLVPEDVHKETGHVGGFKMWFVGE